MDINDSKAISDSVDEVRTAGRQDKMGKSWIIIAVITIGAFAGVESLQCYECEDCAAGDLTDSHLVRCSDYENISIPFGDKIDPALLKTTKNSAINWVCLVATAPGPGNTQSLARSCGTTQICEILNALPGVTCTSCNTDACNGAFKTQHSMAAMMILLVAVLVANKN